MIDILKVKARAAALGDKVKTRVDGIRAFVDKADATIDKLESSGVTGFFVTHLPVVATLTSTSRNIIDAIALLVDVLDDCFDLGSADLDSAAGKPPPPLPQAGA